MVLRGAGDDLRSAGGLFVDQNGQLEAVRRGDRGYNLGFLRHVAAAHRDDLRPGLEEQRAGFEGGGQQPAGIIAQVENQPGQPVAAQFFNGLLELSAGLLVEALDPAVANAFLKPGISCYTSEKRMM